MRKKKELKLKNDIVLSIQYARLLEERDDLSSSLASSKKKTVLGNSDNKLTKNDLKLAEINQAIIDFENKHKKEIYLTDYNHLLSVLSKSKQFNYLKYQIAIEIILDENELYSNNTKIDFIQNVSYSLFDRKNVLHNIQDDYRILEKQVYGTTFKSYLDGVMKNAVPLVNKLNHKELVKYASIVPKKVLFTGGIIAGGTASIFIIRKLRRHANNLRNFGSGDLAKKLIINGLNLKYGKHYFDGSEKLYNNYAKYLFKEINLERKVITKNLFENRFEVDENKKKLEVLHNFDRYIMKEMDNIMKENRIRK